MIIDIAWHQFTPVASLIGGILIAISAISLLFFQGRILGISGILGSMMQCQSTPKGHLRWRIFFIAGILLSSWVYKVVFPMPILQIESSNITLIFAGLLVGFGTRMGSGCTSGHAVCGISRLSIRSLIATFSFMLSGFLCAYLFFHGI
jgi:uncharacterized membrane protein YedE/YeeE